MSDAHPTEDLVPESLAFPSGLPVGCHDATGCAFGLTKREIFAMAAMQGIFAHGYTMPNEGPEAAKYAVQAADWLLKELAK